MEINQIFNMRRIGLLMRNDIITHSKMIWITFGAVFSLLLIGHLVFFQDYNTLNNHSLAYTWILFIGGLWLTSLSFKEVHNHQQCYYFLTLPASQIEKVFNRLVLTAVVYPVVVAILYSLFYLLIAFILSLKTGFFLLLFNPFQENLLRVIKVYIVLQSIIFLGSIYFKSHSVIKTIACIAAFGVILMVYVFLLGWWFFSFNHYRFYMQIPALHYIISFFWFVLPVYCWIVSYIRFTESENF